MKNHANCRFEDSPDSIKQNIENYYVFHPAGITAEPVGGGDVDSPEPACIQVAPAKYWTIEAAVSSTVDKTRLS